MRVAIFAEGSRTTADISEERTASDYFQGTFQPITVLEEKLSAYAGTELHILSEQFGYLLGDASVDRIAEKSVELSEAEKEFADAIVDAAGEVDVLVLLLSSSTFRDTVAEHWNEILSNVQDNSIWCFGASKGALQSIDLSELENMTDTVLVYERVGVAPLGQDTRDDLIQRVHMKYDQES